MLLQEIIGPHNDADRIKRLHALGLSRELISELTGRTQSHVSRLVDDSVYRQHLKYNMLWKRRKREAMKGNNTQTETTTMTPEQLAKLLNDFRLVFAPILNRIADSLEKIARG